MSTFTFNISVKLSIPSIDMVSLTWAFVFAVPSNEFTVIVLSSFCKSRISFISVINSSELFANSLISKSSIAFTFIFLSFTILASTLLSLVFTSAISSLFAFSIFTTCEKSIT